MKIVYPDINFVFETDTEKVPTLVIENPKLLYALLSDLNAQSEGLDGRAVLSENNKILPISKNMELLTSFVPFELNRKTLLNKIISKLSENAFSSYYQETMELVGQLQSFLYRLSFDFPCDLCYPKLSIDAVLKASGVEIRDDGETLAEKILDYMELVTEFDRKKLFLTLNLRSFLSDAEAESFLESVLSHGYCLWMLESSEHPLLRHEKRRIVDIDLCEIGE